MGQEGRPSAGPPWPCAVVAAGGDDVYGSSWLESAEQVVGDVQIHLGRWRRTRYVDDAGGVVREGLTAWRATADLAGDEVSVRSGW